MPDQRTGPPATTSEDMREVEAFEVLMRTPSVLFDRIAVLEKQVEFLSSFLPKRISYGEETKEGTDGP